MEGRLILLALMAFVTPAVIPINFSVRGCGSTKLCANGCDPVNQGCLFGSVANVSMSNGTTLLFELSGSSSGYITLDILEPSMNSSMEFTCGHNTSANGSFYFSSTASLNISNQGSVNGSFIQCTFSFTVNNISNIFNTSVFDISVSSGPVSPTSTGTTVSGTTVASNGTMVASNGTTVAANATAATTINGTIATNITTTTTMMTMMSTTKPTGASVGLHPYASPLLLCAGALFILQKV